MAPVFDFEARLERTSPLGWRVYQEMQRVDVGFMAGSVAFQAFMSLLPLLVSLFILVSIVAGQALATEVLALTGSFLPPDARRLLADAITGQVDASATSILSVALLVWAALGLFKGLDTAFSTIYGTGAENSFRDQVTDALAAFGGILAAIVAGVVTAGASVLSTIPFVGVFASLLLAVGLTVAFLPMYYLFPDTPLSLRQALPGAAVAAVGWTVLQGIFQLYIRFVADPDVSGALGAILVLLTWLYFGSFVILFGAVVNVSLSGPAGESSTEGAVA